MDSTTTASITAAAVMAAGAVSNYADRDTYNAAVHEHAVSIAIMSSPTGSIGKALTQIENSKVFTGTVVSVKKETSSTRGIITLKTGTDRVREGVPEGCEQVRTERTDNPIGRALALKMRDLIGHRVLVWVEVEEINGGQSKVRVLRHAESIGVDAEFSAAA